MPARVHPSVSHWTDSRYFEYSCGGVVLAALIGGWALTTIPQPSEVLFAAGACDDAPACAAGVFCSGFEEGNKAIWDDYDGNPDTTNLLMTDTGPCARTGNRVMRIRVPAGSGGADLIKVLPTAHDKVYARWYQKWETGYDFNALNHGSGLHAGSRNLLGHSGDRPNGSDWFAASIEPLASTGTLNRRPRLYTYYPAMSQDCSNPNGSCWGDSLPCMYDEGSGYCKKPEQRETVMPPQFESGRWYCLEVMLDGGTPVTDPALANGAQNFWVDGVQYGPWTKLWMRTTSALKVNILWLNLYHHGQHSTAGIMLDDVVVSTSPVGCHGAAPTAPSAPTNLRIIKA
jgi:hypothetical protein